MPSSPRNAPRAIVRNATRHDTIGTQPMPVDQNAALRSTAFDRVPDSARGDAPHQPATRGARQPRRQLPEIEGRGLPGSVANLPHLGGHAARLAGFTSHPVATWAAAIGSTPHT